MSRRRKERPPKRVAHSSIALRDDGSLRLGVVADSHSKVHPKLHEHLRALNADAILHAGDIGDRVVLDDLAKINSLHVVRGNIDERAHDLPDIILIDLLGKEGPAMRLLLTHIAVAGPKIRADIAKVARAEKASMIVCGHSHVPFIGRDRGLTVFNPGSVGPRRFHLPIVFGVIEIANGKLSMEHRECESGQRWEPRL